MVPTIHRRGCVTIAHVPLVSRIVFIPLLSSHICQHSTYPHPLSTSIPLSFSFPPRSPMSIHFMFLFSSILLSLIAVCQPARFSRQANDTISNRPLRVCRCSLSKVLPRSPQPPLNTYHETQGFSTPQPPRSSLFVPLIVCRRRMNSSSDSEVETSV